jgi:hypothetical protein
MEKPTRPEGSGQANHHAGGHRLTATIEGLRSWGELDRGRGGGAGVFGEFQRESSEKGRGLAGRRRRAVRGCARRCLFQAGAADQMGKTPVIHVSTAAADSDDVPPTTRVAKWLEAKSLPSPIIALEALPLGPGRQWGSSRSRKSDGLMEVTTGVGEGFPAPGFCPPWCKTKAPCSAASAATRSASQIKGRRSHSNRWQSSRIRCAWGGTPACSTRASSSPDGSAESVSR